MARSSPFGRKFPVSRTGAADRESPVWSRVVYHTAPRMSTLAGSPNGMIYRVSGAGGMAPGIAGTSRRVGSLTYSPQSR